MYPTPKASMHAARIPSALITAFGQLSIEHPWVWTRRTQDTKLRGQRSDLDEWLLTLGGALAIVLNAPVRATMLETTGVR